MESRLSRQTPRPILKCDYPDLYSNAAGTRAYKLYVPSDYNDQQSLPLVVMMHGRTQSPDDFAAGTRMNELAEEQMFLVAYPAQSQSANVSKCWNWFNASVRTELAAFSRCFRGKGSLVSCVLSAV